MGLHETKKLLHNKRNGHRIEVPPKEWEKIFASYTRYIYIYIERETRD
jgi:hypothetical protein